jgi:hypothetical protein
MNLIFEESLPIIDPWFSVRVERNRLLFVTDWTQLPDCNLSETQKDEWKIYRQNLRDITSTFESAEAVIWPKAPT